MKTYQARNPYRHTLTWGLLLWLAGGAHAQAMGGPGGGGGPIQVDPNILVIVLDDVGTDQLSFYEHSDFLDTDPDKAYAETPTLEGLALDSRGMFFTNFFSHPVCTPARASLLSGRHPFRHALGGAINQPDPGDPPSLVCPEPCEDQFLGFDDVTGQSMGCSKMDDNEVFVSELLKQGRPGEPKQYRTGAFGKWHVGYRSDLAPPCTGNTPTSLDTHAVDNGFDRFYGTMGNPMPGVLSVPGSYPEDHYVWRKVKHNAGGNPVVVYPNVPGTPPDSVGIWSAVDVTTDAAQWINGGNKPFFAYVCYNPPHNPWQLPPAGLVSDETFDDVEDMDGSYVQGALAGEGAPREKLALYTRAMLESVDHEIGRLFSLMDPLVLANTWVFVVADNGTSKMAILGEDAAQTTLRGEHGKATVYNFGVRVPLIVRGPQVPIESSQALADHRSDALVSIVDLWQTIGDLTDADAATAQAALSFPMSAANPGLMIDPNVDSQSFIQVLLDRDEDGRDLAFSQRFVRNGWYCGQFDGPSTMNGTQRACYAANNVPVTLSSFSNCGLGGHSPRWVTVNQRCIVDVVAGLRYIRRQTGGNCPTYEEELYALGDQEELTDLLSGANPPTVPQNMMDAMNAHGGW